MRLIVINRLTALEETYTYEIC